MNQKSLEGYCVLLCTQNGSNYLSEQLESISAQSVRPAAILLFDDNSTDNTISIAKRYSDVLPISFVYLQKIRSGAVGAFDAILTYAKESPVSYKNYFLCDQDDIWLPNKAAILLERLSGGATVLPRLVHSELSCFGNASRGRTKLHESLGHNNLTSTSNFPLKSLLFENVIVGASCAFNRLLLEKSVPIPASVFMHDWWLAISCVANGGDIQYIKEPLTRYRIHRESSIGRSGNLIHAIPGRLAGLSRGFSDPWLRIVVNQIRGLPFDRKSGELSGTVFNPLYCDISEITQENNVKMRYRAWCRLTKLKIWSVPYKDFYYKVRLFTDYVLL